MKNTFNSEKRIFNQYLFLTVRLFTYIAFILCFFHSDYIQAENNSSTKTLLILHTNDIHDYIRPDYDGVGGLPFISGFIRDVKAKRDDVIVLDAGDVTEKGDLVARKTKGEITFEALSRVGYNAWTPGNHDHDFGIEALHRFSELSGMDILCINLFKEDGSLEFNPSKIYEINGIRVGVIGAIAPRPQLSLDIEGTALAMADESRRLKSETDIIIAVVHIPTRHAQFISELAPDIDVFITGHSHEITHQAIKVPNTGALIVQAGSYANYVGWLEVELDISNRKIDSYESRLIEMDHLKISPDIEMIEWIRQNENELAPEARKVVSWSPRRINYAEVGILAAEALNKATGADVAFNKTRHIVRATLPAGILDLNAIYRTGGERGHQLIEVELTGTEIHSYLLGLQISDWIQTQWSGFYWIMEEGMINSDLDPEKLYRVVMPEREWRQRFLELFEQVAENPENWPGVKIPDRPLYVDILDISWTDAMVYFLNDLNANNIGLIEILQQITQETGQLQLISSGY
jgi:2',3'-cyclic-nucleotide 2'-phosphodiesterase (5'-nucleotidase family)